ncbi:MAG: hypothetical protein WCT36_00925 [Candidatus Gracilibacteria bacterium]
MSQGGHSNNSLGLHDREAGLVLGNARADLIVEKLDRGLAYVKSNDPTSDILFPDSIEGVTADALERGDVDRVLADMTGLIGTQLKDTADAGNRRLEALRAIRAWRAEHQAEINELKLESPAYLASVKAMQEAVVAFEHKDFESLEKATGAWLELTLKLREHNTRFVNENANNRSISETPVQEVKVSLRGKPFTIQLFRVGARKELGLAIKNVSGVGLTVDETMDIQQVRRQEAA